MRAQKSQITVLKSNGEQVWLRPAVIKTKKTLFFHCIYESGDSVGLLLLCSSEGKAAKFQFGSQSEKALIYLHILTQNFLKVK